MTADADGQHALADVLRIVQALVENPGRLVMGARQFDTGVPLRSRFGNVVTSCVMRALVGHNLRDTQTGLRGIPMDLIPRLMRSRANGYEFEMDMLLICKRERRRIREVPIQTIYIEENRSSHFNPIHDSMRIYFLLLRFGLTSIVTALIDNAVFAVIYFTFSSVLGALASGRLLATIFNYLAVRRIVFHSREQHLVVLPKYVLLVALSGIVSYGLIMSLVSWLGLPVIAAKLFAEALLFIANFVIQRDLIFFRPVGEDAIYPLIERILAGEKVEKVVRNHERFELGEARPFHRGLMDSTISSYYGAVLEVSRGCPFLCEFCDIRILPDNNRAHLKDPTLIVEEVDHICRQGVTSFLLACDNFIGDGLWAEEVVDKLIEWRQRSKYRPVFYTWLTINLHKMPELMKKMRRAGFDVLFIGVESFDSTTVRLKVE